MLDLHSTNCFLSRVEFQIQSLVNLMTCLVFFTRMGPPFLSDIGTSIYFLNKNVLVTANEVLVKERYNIVGIREKVVLDENQSTTLVLMVLLSLWLKNLHVPSVANKPNNTPIFTRYRQPFKKISQK